MSKIQISYASTGTTQKPMGCKGGFVDLSLRLQNIQSAQSLRYIKEDRVSIITVDGMLVQYDISCDETTLIQKFSFVSQSDRDAFLVVLLRSIYISQSITTFRISGVKDLFNIRDVPDLLRDIVMSHNSISTIILQNNDITQAQFEKLFAYLCVRMSEIYIDLQFNPIDHSGSSIIADLVNQHCVALSGSEDLKIGVFNIISPMPKSIPQYDSAEAERLIEEELAKIDEEFATKALGYSEDVA